MILNSPYISGSLTVTGNTNLIGALTVTGSLAGTATSSSFAFTASSAVSAYTAASAVNATTALTASYATSFTVGGTLTAQTLVVQTITSSTDFVTGSTRFGSLLTNTHDFTGSVRITGSLTVNTTGTEFQVTNNGVVMGNLLADSHSVTGSLRVTGSGTFSSTISAIGESTLFQGVFNDPVPNTVAVLKMSSTPTPSLASTVVGARMSGNATANVDTYAGYFSNISTVSGTGLAYGIFATASFHTFIGETRFAQGVFNDPINGTAASIKISAVPVANTPTAVFTTGITGTASSNQNTFAGYFTNTSTVSGTGINYGIFATGSRHFFGGNVGIGTTTPTYQLDLSGGATVNERLRLQRGSDDTNQFAVYGWNSIRTYRANVSIASAQTDFSIIQSGSDGSRTPFYISSAGNVGIGTTSPTSTLHVSSSIASGQVVRIQTSLPAGRNYFQWANGSGDMGYIGYGGANSNFFIVNQLNADMLLYTNDTERMRITSGGNVGIGTSSPQYLLTVGNAAGGYTSVATIASSGAGTSTTNLLLQNTIASETAGTGVNLNFSGVSNWLGRINAQFTGSTGSGNADMTFWTPSGGSILERMRITSGGNVGIGTSSPSQRLTIAQTNGYPVMDFNNSGTTYGDLGFQVDKMVLSSYSTTPLTFWTNATERMRITSGGNVGIGTSSPSQKLEVNGGIASNNGTDSTTVLPQTVQIQTNGSSSTAAASAYLRLGDTLNGKFWALQIDASYQLATFHFSGGVWTKLGYQTTGGTWTNSDERRKENIELSNYGLNEVLQLIPKKFNFKIDERKIINLGFIAQDVLPIIPEAVQSDIDNEQEYYAMNYTNLVPVLVKAIQELKAELDEATTRIKTLESR